MTGCRPSCRQCFHRMRPDRSQPLRDAGPGGWRQREKTLCGERVRCVQVPERKKAGGREGRGCSMKRKLAASTETHVTAVVKFRPGECCFRVGRAQAWNTLAVLAAWRAGELCTSDKNGAAFATTPKKCALIEEVSDQLWTSCCRRCGLPRSGVSAEQSEVWILCNGLFNALKASSLVEQRSCSRRWRRINLRSLGEYPHYIARCPAHSGDSHRQRCRAIRSFSAHCTNQWPCSFTALLKKGFSIGEKGVSP